MIIRIYAAVIVGTVIGVLLLLLVKFLIATFKYRYEKFIDFSRNNDISMFDKKLSNCSLSIRNNILYLRNNYDKALYSSFDIHTFNTNVPYFNKIYECVKQQTKKTNILVLGFGLGAIPLYLSQDKDINLIDSVDNDNELFSNFKLIFPNHSRKIKLHYSDANKFLTTCTKKYDIIIDDVFNGLNKIELNYKLLKNKLNYNGTLLINNYDVNFKNITIINKIKKIFNQGTNYKLSIPKQTVYAFNNL